MLPTRSGTSLARVLFAASVLAVVVATVGRSRFTTATGRGLGGLDLVAGAIPVALVALVARADVHRRRRWVLLTVAVAAGPFAQIWASYLDSLSTPRVSDLIRLFGTAVLAAAAAMIVHKASPSALRSDRIDGIILVLGGGAALSMLWPDQLTDVGNDYEVRITLFAILLDLIVVAVAASSISAMRYRPSTSIALFAGAGCLLLVADLGQLHWATNANEFRSGVLVFPGWTHNVRLVATVLIALSAWLPLSARRPTQERPSQLSVMPIMFSLVALGILGAEIVAAVSIWSAVLALGAVAAVILRTALAVHELHTGTESFRLARTDELTSLTNRRGFLEGMDRLIEVAPGTVAVMIIDLNGFKEVNDSLGHHAGDELLRLVADRFRPVVGDAGLLARLGGDEFGVVIIVHDDRAALEGADLLQRALDEAFMVDGISVRVGAAIGVALYPSHSNTRSGVLRSADVAMYDAKHRRTGVEMYHSASDFQTREKLQLLDDLRQAIEHRGLSLYYQPKVDLRDGRITSSEALVRWQHPTRGLMLPDEFVPLAERAGLVPGLTRAVLAQAIAFHAERCPHVGVSVNISHRDVVDDNLAEYIADLLKIYDYPPQKLTLEITETELAHDPDRASRSIATLRAAGMRISIDDFGVGYSSMARLLDLAVDEVKIDKSFVFAIGDDMRAIAIIRSTVELAAALGLQVVAEGIENPQVLAEVRRAGVDVGQGYVITRPLAGKDYMEFLSSRTKGAAEPKVRPPALPARPLSGPVRD